MCTVTFIPVGNSVYITHNRDEHHTRTTAIPPAIYTINGCKVMFPKDRNAGGTWIAMNQNGNAAVLLNGAFVKHDHLPPYRKSRGLVILDIIATEDMTKAWKISNLRNIEPFTLIMWDGVTLNECRWDGSQKHTLRLDSLQTQMWSSVTLYDPDAMTKRKNWFDGWMNKHPSPSLNDIMQFQYNAGDGNPHTDLRMNRDGVMLTVSITSMQLTPQAGLMKYLDLRDAGSYVQKMTFDKATVDS